MNEPSVFDDSIEKTFPKNLVHYGGVEHKDVHNIYGFTQVSTFYLSTFTLRLLGFILY